MLFRSSDNSKAQTDRIAQIVEVALESVERLVNTGEQMLEFFQGTVVPDYGKFEILAKQYESDAKYYSDVSSALGATSEELAASIVEITSVVDTVTLANEELNDETKVASAQIEEAVGKTIQINKCVQTMEACSGALNEIVTKFNM